MSIQHGNRGIVKKDLQLYYNREFSKSFPGQATTNLIGTYSGDQLTLIHLLEIVGVLIMLEAHMEVAFFIL